MPQRFRFTGTEQGLGKALPNKIPVGKMSERRNLDPW